MPYPFRRSAVGAALLLLGSLAFAQAADTSSTAPQGDTPSLGEMTVTGNPLGSSETVTPAAQLSGEGLTLRAKPTLGETLDGLPGVSSSYFGPNASRPIIRGLDGDRIRILQNGGATVDASALSYDHAVPTEALVSDRIEVLRGPAALLYGGSAVGGVVNVIDNRIPREPIDGVGGKADLGLASGNRERSGAVEVEAGNDRYALHVDAFDRKTGDVRVPTQLECEKPGSPGLASRICNSASSSRGGAVGGSLFFDQGYIGASASTFRSDYGTVAEDDVTIGMRSDRYALEGEYRPGGLIESVKARLSHTDYHHVEYEAGEVGTTFLNRGNDLRVEARHARLGPVEGVIGLQAENTHFSAIGEEAFAPPSRTQSTALFLHEELATGWGRLTFGARTEQVKVQSFGSEDVDRFEAGTRKFHPGSAAIGALVNVAPRWQVTSNLSYTQRAPKDYELFANGPHVATAAWETGDSSLGLEKSTSLDLGAAWKDGPNRFAVNAYISNFSNYIGLTPTGDVLTEEGERNPAADSDEETYPEYRYQGVRARFYGLEASGTVRLWGGTSGLFVARAADSGTLDLLWRGDIVRATNRDTGEPLPRISPARVGASLAWHQGPWSAGAGFDAWAAQNRVPDDGTRATGGYTLWNASLAYRTRVQWGNSSSHLLWYLRLDNITNRLAYSATSILTSTAYPKAPLPGRSVKIGLQVTF